MSSINRVHLATTLFAGAIAMAHAQSITVTTAGWENTGIEIVPPSAPNFTSIALAALNPASARNIVELFPYSFILRNHSAQAIAAYGARWECTKSVTGKRSQGLVFVNLSTFQSPEAIPPGVDRLVTPVLGLGYQPGPASYQLEQIKSRALARFGVEDSLTITPDVVVFGDGLVLGKDTYNTAARLRAITDARRQLAASITQQLHAGATHDDINSALSRVLSSAAPKREGLNAKDAAYQQEFWRQGKSRAQMYSQIIRERGLNALGSWLEKQMLHPPTLPAIHY